MTALEPVSRAGFVSQTLPPGTRLAEFVIGPVIGHGGFGVTYRGEDANLKQPVAIKEYLPIMIAARAKDGYVQPRSPREVERFEWGRERFLEEARILAHLNHPAIVPVLRHLEANGTAYNVMRFEDGQVLPRFLDREGQRLSADDLKALVMALLDGVEAMHRHGYIHRDIKPDNVIVRPDRAPVLIDFGAARHALADQSMAPTAVISPGFAPIEQYAAGSDHGAASDVYGLAATVYWIVVGSSPPPATDRQMALLAGRPDPLQRPSPRRLPVGEAALDAILAGLTLAPAARLQTVAAWRGLLETADWRPTAWRAVRGWVGRMGRRLGMAPGKRGRW